MIVMTNACTPSLPGMVAREFKLYRAWTGETAPPESIRGLLTSYAVGAPAELMDQFPNLEIIANYGVGVDNVDLPAARERKIVVTNTPDVLTESVAEFALALLLATTRQVARADRFVRAQKWGKEPFPLAIQLHGKQCGIVGMGRIGQAIAERAAAFGMKVAYHARHDRHLPYRYESTLLHLARDCDFLIVVVPGGDETRHLINAAVMEALGPEGVLVNVARGSVVDERALIETLQSGKLGSAGLDVFADEPNVPAELMEMEQVVLAPHQASATQHARQAMADLCLGNLRSYFAGKGPLTPVS